MKQTMIVRADLKMNRGKEAAQVAHACLNAAKEASDAVLREWMEGGGCKVVVSVGSEAVLLAAFYDAKVAQLPCALIKDAGRTYFDGVATYTCVAVGPGLDAAIDAITGTMKLR